jgi:Fe-S protein assembly chaperone HscA/FeS assembly protein IscX
VSQDPTAPDVPASDRELIVGIDLGTTNSLIARFGADGPEVIRDESGDPIVPSIVTRLGDRFVVGRRARELAVDHPLSTVYSIKRLMGRSVADLSDDERRSLPYEVVASERDLARIRVGDRVMGPEEISALILRELKDRAERRLGRKVEKAVITVPAYFDDAQRQATRVAGKLAGLDVVRIVNEPTAAALAYGLDRTKSGCVAVYDLGGGTFDVSILEIRDGIFRVRATAGDTQLGGDDFDRKLMQRLLAKLPGGTAPDPSLLQAAKQAAEAAKIELSDRDVVSFAVVDERSGTTLEETITRRELEELVAPEVDRTLQSCRRALADAELGKDELRAVVLVGGSTRMPYVRQRVEQFFGKKPYTGLDPDLVVALGAAVQADVLAGGARDVLLLDVIPLSLGIETYGGAVAKILMRNTPIPAQASDAFTTHVANQTAIDVHVLQGERELVKDCRSLGRFKLRGLPPLPAGMVRMDVQFLVDENGVLTVHAKERFTGIESSIEVVPSYGLTDAEVARMVDESFQFARADFEAHQRIDLENECRTMIDASRRILASGAHGLEPAALSEIEAAIGGVQKAMNGAPVKELKAAYDRFVNATVPLAGIVMSEVANQAIAGRTVEEVLAAKPAGAAASAAAVAARTSSPASKSSPTAPATKIGGAPSRIVTIHGARAPSVGAAARGQEDAARAAAPSVAAQPASATAGPGKDCGDLGGGFHAAPAPRKESSTMKLDWHSTEEIGIRLHEKFPDVDPLTVRFTDLHKHVLALDGFTGDPKKSNEKLLEAIQMAWLDEHNDA